MSRCVQQKTCIISYMSLTPQMKKIKETVTNINNTKNFLQKKILIIPKVPLQKGAICNILIDAFYIMYFCMYQIVLVL